MTATTYELPRGRYSSTPVDGDCFRSVVTFTRTANTTAYTAGDVVGINAAGSPGSAIHEFEKVGTSGGFILIQSALLLVGLTSVPVGMSGFRLHLYTSSPTAILDNAAFDLVSGERSAYLGFLELPTPTDLGSTLFSRVDYSGQLIKLADGSTSMFAELETRGGYTPASATPYEVRLLTNQYGL